MNLAINHPRVSDNKALCTNVRKYAFLTTLVQSLLRAYPSRDPPASAAYARSDLPTFSRPMLTIFKNHIFYFLDCLDSWIRHRQRASKHRLLYEPTLCNFPEERRFHLRHGGNLESLSLSYTRLTHISMISQLRTSHIIMEWKGYGKKRWRCTAAYRLLACITPLGEGGLLPDSRRNRYSTQHAVLAL